MGVQSCRCYHHSSLTGLVPMIRHLAQWAEMVSISVTLATTRWMTGT